MKRKGSPILSHLQILTRSIRANRLRKDQDVKISKVTNTGCIQQDKNLEAQESKKDKSDAFTNKI